MSSRTSYFWFYIRHSLLLLYRYQQFYIYFLIISSLIFMPLFFGIKTRYFTFLVLMNSLFVFWLFSPLFLHMFSFSTEDTRSMSLFPLKFNDLAFARNILNIGLLIIANGLSIVLTGLFYPKTNTTITEIMVLSIMHLLPAMSIGNMTSRSSLSWTGKTTFSWKGIYVILFLNFNIILFKILQLYFIQPIFISIIVIEFLFYLGIYYLSFHKIVREISTYFSSIAEK